MGKVEYTRASGTRALDGLGTTPQERYDAEMERIAEEQTEAVKRAIRSDYRNIAPSAEKDDPVSRFTAPMSISAELDDPSVPPGSVLAVQPLGRGTGQYVDVNTGVVYRMRGDGKLELESAPPQQQPSPGFSSNRVHPRFIGPDGTVWQSRQAYERAGKSLNVLPKGLKVDPDPSQRVPSAHNPDDYKDPYEPRYTTTFIPIQIKIDGSFQLYNVPVVECDDCGSAVTNQVRHTHFHARIVEQDG